MTKPIQFTLTPEQMTYFLAWRVQVEAGTGRPVIGVVFSFVVSHQGDLQIIIRPSTDEGFTRSVWQWSVWWVSQSLHRRSWLTHRDLKERVRYRLLKKGDHLRECSPRVITGSN